MRESNLFCLSLSLRVMMLSLLCCTAPAATNSTSASCVLYQKLLASRSEAMEAMFLCLNCWLDLAPIYLEIQTQHFFGLSAFIIPIKAKSLGISVKGAVCLLWCW